MAITALYVKNSGKSFILREVGNFNKNLAQAQKIDPSFNLLEPRSVDDFDKWSNADIARELNRMRSLFDSKNFKPTKYNAQSKIKIALGVKKELDALRKIGNKRAAKRYAQFPDVLGGKLDNIEKNRYAPLSMGTGKTINDIIKRAKTIQNRSRESFYQAGYDATKYHLLNAMKQNLNESDYNEIKSIIDHLSSEQLYLLMQDKNVGHYLSFDFIYDKEIPRSEKYTQIKKALEYRPI